MIKIVAKIFKTDEVNATYLTAYAAAFTAAAAVAAGAVVVAVKTVND